MLTLFRFCLEDLFRKCGRLCTLINIVTVNDKNKCFMPAVMIYMYLTFSSVADVFTKLIIVPALPTNWSVGRIEQYEVKLSVPT